jgi:hypothetical protein
VEAWAPDHGAPLAGEEPALAAPPVELDAEVPASRWAPRVPRPDPAPPASLLFTDGVRRVDAQVWITTAAGGVRPGLCASYAAGVVRCRAPGTRSGGPAELVAADVARGLFTPAEAEAIATPHGTWAVRAVAGDQPDAQALALQQHMGALEVAAARRVAGDGGELIVVDGPLTGRQDVPGAVGYVKTHHVAYLPATLEPVVRALRAGERTPLFVTAGAWSRWSWYLRLAPPAGHPWSGVVRCEATADLALGEAAALADRTAGLLPAFASAPHKDPRAPQNLYPIAGLERALRRRLGDALLLHRALRVAAGAPTSA